VEVHSGLLDAAVPTLLLQPLLENALRHGIAKRPEGGLVSIHAEAEGPRLRLEVRNEGPGCTPGRLGEGIGTANTQARLEQLFGPRQRFHLLDLEGRGACARVEIPLAWTDQGERLLAKASA
jgi:LytS/YehU family sensor histidine kinase